MWMLSSLLGKASLQCLCSSCCQCPELQFVLSSSSNWNWHIISSEYLEPACRRSWAPVPHHLVWEHSKWGLVLHLKNQTQSKAWTKQILCSMFCSETPQEMRAESQEPRFWLWQFLVDFCSLQIPISMCRKQGIEEVVLPVLSSFVIRAMLPSHEPRHTWGNITGVWHVMPEVCHLLKTVAEQGGNKPRGGIAHPETQSLLWHG